MRVAAVQCGIRLAELSFNLATVIDHIKTAAARDTALLVFPECMLSGYTFESRDEAMSAAIPIDHPAFESIATAIRTDQQSPMTVSIGTLLREGSGSNARLFNAAVLVSSRGVVGIYRKIHLPALGVDRFVDRGNGPFEIHECDGMRIGMSICYDCSFPEPMRLLGLAGADVIALGTNWPVAAQRTAEVVPPARSMENHYYFIAANRIGTERGFTFCGRSSICGPDGVVLAVATDDSPQVLTAQIDVQSARDKRIERTPGAHVIDRMADRQPHLYADLSRNHDQT